MLIPRTLGTIHIVGIGGIGMSAIADVLQAQGHRVQGSDQKDSANCERLRAKGIPVAIGHRAENLGHAAAVVISTAVKAGNPELDGARARGLPIIRRAELLAEIMRPFRTIAITGTHGKTTTTSLIAHLLTAGALDPTVITGGIILDWGSNARLGKGPWMVVEADESDGTFVRLPSEIGIVTNADPEHLDYFGSVEAMNAAYAHFMAQIPFYGRLIVCIDHPVTRRLVDDLALRQDGRPLLTYGWDDGADLQLTRVDVRGRTTTFDARLSARVPGGPRALEALEVPVPGEHNALNALAAFAAAAATGLDDLTIRQGLAGFSGVKRRFQPTGTWNGVAIFDDYGHHPVEIAAVLKAARTGAAGGRVLAICEPHRFSRLRDLFGDFAACFGAADMVVIGPLYAAGESPLPGIGHAELAAAVRAAGHPDASHVDSAAALVLWLRTRARSGDTVLVFGAGHATDWAHALPAQLADAGAP
jgi:UDP-N-acetylmuramate--alanine ligase